MSRGISNVTVAFKIERFVAYGCNSMIRLIQPKKFDFVMDVESADRAQVLLAIVHAGGRAVL